MNRSFICKIGVLVFLGVFSVASADEAQKYKLRYKLSGGQQLRYEVTHVAKTKTRIKGEEEIANVHTVSQRHWDVSDVTDGAATFDHIVDAVEMTQQQGENEEIRWDSTSDLTPPAPFAKVAEQIGSKVSTIKINQRGQELEREDFGGTKSKLGMGSLALAFPKESLAIGGTWTVPREVKVRTEAGEVKTIKIRELYRLEQVKTGVATLSIRSEPLTPMNEESIKAQVVQQLSDGEIKFDLDAGHMISKQLTWDETVVGFQGPNSLMEYRARMTETLLDPSSRSARLGD